MVSGLTSSTTHNGAVLIYYVSKSDNPDAYASLWAAAKTGSQTALNALTKSAIANADTFWVEKSASLHNLEAQLYLALNASSDKTQLYWYEQAAKSGHSPSQFELSLIAPNNEKRLEYLKQAANAKHKPAIIALAKYWHDTNNVKEAMKWLSKAAQLDPSSEFEFARLLWKKGQYQNAKIAFSHAALMLEKAKDYLAVTQQIIPTSISEFMAKSAALHSSCAQQVQFVATSLDSAVQARQFKRKFENDRRFTELPICLNPILWLKPNKLNCSLLNHRQRCDLSVFAKHLVKPKFTQLVIFLPQGTAYVQNGVMYLDQADTYSVFVHELAHFVGFVDEYAVSKQLASQYCDENGAPNLLIGEDVYQSSRFQRWLQYAQASEKTEGVARTIFHNEQDDMINQSLATLPNKHENILKIGSSRTCSKLNIRAFKPSTSITFLEHHDTHTIPRIYITMWRDLLNENYHKVAIAEHF